MDAGLGLYPGIRASSSFRTVRTMCGRIADFIFLAASLLMFVLLVG